MNNRLLMTLGALLVASTSTAGRHNDVYPSYENPVRSMADDEIRHLPGLNNTIDFKQFSGYLSGDEGGEKFIHYWFVESQNDPSNDPVLLWLNGGPGCSSLGGLLAEIGPFQVNSDGKTLSLRETSWNKVANVLFLETPVGVGFSYQRAEEDYQTDDTTAELNYLALKSFFKKFPQYKSSPLYLSGESYAGVYLPMLGTLIDEDPDFNLKGLAIGNGLFHVELQSISLVFFAYHHGLVGKSAWERLSQACCEGLSPSLENCRLDDRDLTMSCLFAKNAIINAALQSKVNPYNIYADCASCSSNQSAGQSPKCVASAALPSEIDEINSANFAHSSQLTNEPKRGSSRAISPPCLDSSFMSSYLNHPEVRQEIHIPLKIDAWSLCIRPDYIKQYARDKVGMAPYLQKMIDSKRNLKMLIFNGDVDAVCNFLGNDWFIERLGRLVVKDHEPWMVDGQVAGLMIQYEGVTYATVKGSGHMVPQDKPMVAFEMIKRFLNSRDKVVEL